MKKIALHGLEIDSESQKYLDDIIDHFQHLDVEIILTKDFYERNLNSIADGNFRIADELTSEIDATLSLGGDGTFLETVLWVGKSEIPILGINMGRLGFLASIAKERIRESLSLFSANRFEIEARSMIHLDSSGDLFDGKPYALNECAILRRDTSSMIKVKSYINDTFLNTYWADGLMVATPTGSTGYSLSCGGPLIMPDSKDFVITPVSPHNLNVRPLIVSDNSILRFEIESRSNNYLVSLDSRSEPIENNEELVVKKADFVANIIRIEGMDYPDTIRNKLGWGFDKRN
jgi:NAD+ kinase